MTTRGHVAVVDQGSTSTKAGVYTLEGECLHALTRPVERRVDGPSVRNDARQIAADVEALLEELRAQQEFEAIGLACQRSTCLLWERDSGEPLTEALSWQDRSAAQRVEALASHAPAIASKTGLRLSAYYSAPKLAALLETIEDGLTLGAAGELVAGTLDAFLAHRLTGRPSTEPGIAGRTLLYDLESDGWDDDLCDLFGVPRAALPELTTSTGERGAWRGVPLLAVAGDQQAALIGHRGWREGTIAAHFGTGAFVLASTGARLLRHEGLLTAVLASTPRGRHLQIEGSVNSAGSAVDWARRLVDEDLDAWTDRSLDDDTPWVLPAFTGTAAPWWRADTTAVIAGLGLETTGTDLLAGVLAGLAHRVLDCVEAIAEAGVATETLRVSGKLTRLGGLVQRLADAGQIPVEISAEEETGAIGLVRLLRSELEGTDDSLLQPVPTRRRVEPRWSEQKAREVRDEWHGFRRRAMGLA